MSFKLTLNNRAQVSSTRIIAVFLLLFQPWSGRLPSKYESSVVTTTKKIDPQNPAVQTSDGSTTAIKSTIDRQHKSYSDDIFSDAENFYGSELSISFDQIGSELTQCNGQREVLNSRWNSSQGGPIKDRKTYDIQMQEYSNEIERVITSSDSSPEKSPRYLSPRNISPQKSPCNISPQKAPCSFFSKQQKNQKPDNGLIGMNPSKPTEMKRNVVSRVGRGRGRGMFLFQNNKTGVNVKPS